jgi:hypothetical protein
MTALNSAAELLTGVDLGTAPRSSETTIVRDHYRRPDIGTTLRHLGATAQSWTGVDAGLLKSGRRRRITVPSGPSLGFAVLKDLLRLLWPFVYSPSSPLFLLALTLELCALARELAAYVR